MFSGDYACAVTQQNRKRTGDMSKSIYRLKQQTHVNLMSKAETRCDAYPKLLETQKKISSIVIIKTSWRRS